jgi:hypothetical protein
MGESRIEDQKIRNELRSKRNLLFADFTKNPSNTRLALEIKSLDDRIADLDSSVTIKTLRDFLKPNSVVQ